jgi:cold shock CspA family protein
MLRLNNGYGFLGTEYSAKNLFFFWDDLEGIDFNELAIGDELEFEFGTNERGECARHITRPGAFPVQQENHTPAEPE